MDLPQVRVYRPFDRGVYQVAPLLKTLDLSSERTIPGNGLFQIDCDWKSYRDSKREALADDAGKYVGFNQLDPRSYGQVLQFMARRLTAEYPNSFTCEPRDDDLLLHCGLSGRTLEIGSQPDPETWQAFSLEIQEDFAIWQMTEDREWLAAISILSPNHWAPEEKLGRPFASVHGPVAGMGPMNARSRALVETMILKGPFERFAWGLSTDTRLNHHPRAPRGFPPELWAGRRFDPTAPQLFVRTERQCLIPFPSVGASLFTIRTSFEDVEKIAREPAARAALVSALKSMSPESQVYKGLQESYQDILDWLQKN
jgi:hypothetical protein